MSAGFRIREYKKFIKQKEVNSLVHSNKSSPYCANLNTGVVSLKRKQKKDIHKKNNNSTLEIIKHIAGALCNRKNNFLAKNKKKKETETKTKKLGRNRKLNLCIVK